MPFIRPIPKETCRKALAHQREMEKRYVPAREIALDHTALAAIDAERQIPERPDLAAWVSDTYGRGGLK